MNRFAFLIKKSLFAILWGAGLNAVAQISTIGDRGLVTYKLGSDTTVSQYFEVNKTHFSTIIILFSGQVVKYEGSGDLDGAGDLKTVRSKMFNLDSSGRWKLVSEATNIFNGDSTVYSVGINGNVVSRRAVVGKGIVSNAADACSFFVFPYVGFFAPRKAGDTLFHCQLSFGECRTYHVARLSHNELKIGSNVMGRIKLYVDDNNRLQKADAIGSSLNFIATVERQNKDYPAYLNSLAERKSLTGALAAKTFRDTAVFVSKDKRIEVDYWRPYQRNRVIFGAVVPWNRIWRTGANNATQLRTTSDLEINSNLLPAGKFSIWTYPAETGWQLIFNKKAAVWGTEYDSTADLFKVPMHVEKGLLPQEVLKISLLPIENTNVRLQIEWEYYRAWTDLKIK